MLHVVYSKLFIFCEWIMRLALLNILFVFFTLAGCIIFGITPAYTAMMKVFKQLYEGQDVRIFSRFYFIYKTEFIKSNKFGLLYGYVIGLLFANFLFIQTLPVAIQTFAMLLLIIGILIVAMSLLYVFPLYLKFEATTWRLIKNSFFIALAFLPRTLLSILLIGAVIVFCFNQPIFIFIFGFSSLAAITSITSNECLQKIQPS